MKKLKTLIPLSFVIAIAALSVCGCGSWDESGDVPDVNTGNRAPVAKAGPDQSVSQNTLVTMNGLASFDADGNAITHAWTQTSDPAVTLYGAGTGTASFTPSRPGTYIFQLIVNDGSLSSAPDSISVTVNELLCGNSVPESGEACDDGENNGNPGYCNLSCDGTTSATCGNGVPESGEACDTGSESATCDRDCTVAECGDGATNANAGETCDDGNTSIESCAYGISSCVICNSSCVSEAGATSYCGDSITNAADGETCDDGNTTTETCTSGQNSCTICNSTCRSAAGADITAPSVTLTFPVNSDINVPPNTKSITATFSEMMNPDTLTTVNFKLECPAGAPITATAVTYPPAGNVATLALPAAPDLPPSTVCSATVAIAVEDLAGNALAADKVWSFTTGTSPTDFESFALGEVHGQDGWTSGHGSPTCPLYDVAVVSNTYGYLSFDDKSLRISNAITCTSFMDMTFSKSLVDEAGETSASVSAFSGGTRQPYFEAQWDFASTVPGSEQPGLSVSASPDQGEGGRMSWLQMQDTPSGLQLDFADFQHSVLDFVLTPIATGLDRTVPHTVKITMQFIDGASNDVVKVYLDGALIHTGTSWEDYFRDWEGGFPRPVDSIMFRTAGTAVPANSGNGILIDNFSSFSGPSQN